MITFLPYSSFEKSAQVLDYRRLGKQRIEAKQIYECLVYGKWKNWRWHPVMKMWDGYTFALLEYGAAMCKEWIARGYNDNTLPFFSSRLCNTTCNDIVYPPWLGDERVHSSHRANLIRKNKEFYSKYGWTESPAYGYYWP